MRHPASTPVIIEGYVDADVLDEFLYRGSLHPTKGLTIYPFRRRGGVRVVAEIRTEEELSAG